MSLQYSTNGESVAMKVLCHQCKTEYDWDSEDIFIHPSTDTIDFTCRTCLKEKRAYKKNKIHLKK